MKKNLKKYLVDTLNAMGIGLFASLIIGLVLKNIGNWLQLPILVETGTLAQKMTGVAITVAIAYRLKAPLLVLVSSAIVGYIANKTGGVIGSLVVGIIAIEAGKLVSGKTTLDILVTPAVTLIIGMLTASFLGEHIQFITNQIGEFIELSTELQPFIMSVVLAVLMGMLLTLPISSAAIAISLSLSGEAAGAATIGCAAQMIGFAVMSFRDNNIGGVISQGLGTSMLQIPNIVKNPKIWIPPIITSAILSPIAILLFHLKNVPTGAGMGTSGLVGQIGTIQAMGETEGVLYLILIFHFIAPALLTYLIYLFFLKMDWIKQGDLKLSTK